ncbi:MAG: DUF411 domain-containing protein [Desulfuromonadales bacterium]
MIIEAVDTKKVAEIKVRYNIPDNLQSCHTAIVDGYIIEGHVPVEEVKRLLKERPDILGLSVPGMPAGSPGMEMADGASEPFEVISFDKLGRTTVFATYPK